MSDVLRTVLDELFTAVLEGVSGICSCGYTYPSVHPVGYYTMF